MPLITTDIFQARSVVATLELRAQSAELAASALKSTVDTLTSAQQNIVDRAAIEHEFTVGQIQVNAQQNVQQAGQVSPDISLDNFIAALGLSIALAEATMPDRTIGPVSATVQSFLTFNVGPDGMTKVPGLRLYQPELGAPTALATTSFDLAKIPAGPLSPAPRSLYSVLLDKQALYAGSYWIGLQSGTPPQAPAAQVVAEIGKIFASIGGWSFTYLLQEAADIAGFETTLGGALQSSPPKPGPAGAPAAYSAAVANLASLISSLHARTMFVAGDLYALTAALDTTTTSARGVHA